jgi:trimeric autotransporter adhesin
VALSGDTLAVGAMGESSTAQGVNGNQADNGALDSGAVYIFH